jgi:hypothetical protein
MTKYYYCVKNCIINKVEAKAGMCLSKKEWNIFLNNPIYDIDLASYYFQIVPTKDSVVTEFWGNGSKKMMEEKIN